MRNLSKGMALLVKILDTIHIAKSFFIVKKLSVVQIKDRYESPETTPPAG